MDVQCLTVRWSNIAAETAFYIVDEVCRNELLRCSWGGENESAVSSDELMHVLIYLG